jgi:hypothetical protein
VTFEETLAAVLGLVGQRLSVTIYSPEGTVVAILGGGELKQGEDWRAGKPELSKFGEYVVLSFDDSENALVLEERHFERAQWQSGLTDEPEHELAIWQQGVHMVLSPKR